MNEKNFIGRLKLLIFKPKEGFKKVVPYIESKIFRYKRNIFEFFGNEKYSKPYNGIDELLKFIDKRDGFFVECGGNDGYFQDPTYYLEKFRGWGGIIIEPLSISELCKKNRKRSAIYNCALVPFDFKEKFVTMVDCNAMSVVKGGVENYEKWVKAGEEAQQMKSQEIQVPARTLEEVIGDYRDSHTKCDIDLLVLDVEGYEAEVLKGFNIKKYNPSFVMVEAHTDKKRGEIETVLGEDYKLLSKISQADYLYRYLYSHAK